MGVQEEWKEQQERDILFANADQTDLPLRLLEIGNTNRVVTVREARLLVVLNMMADRMQTRAGSWGWIRQFGQYLEEYQLTVGDPENSRQSFLRALKAQLGLDKPEKDGLKL
jgi:hypothetical protein